jgi:hypothetical protein
MSEPDSEMVISMKAIALKNRFIAASSENSS